jgi:hypothetical protein
MSPAAIGIPLLLVAGGLCFPGRKAAIIRGWGGIIQESLGAIIPLQTGGFTGIGRVVVCCFMARTAPERNCGCPA